MNDSAAFRLSDLHEGMEFSFEVSITEDMINAFASLSGDESPVHIEKDFAQAHGFSQRVAHGVLLNALVSRLIGMYCPGRFAILHSLAMQYHNPTYSNDVLTVSGTIEQVSESAKSIILRLRILDKQTKTIKAKGKAQVGFLT